MGPRKRSKPNPKQKTNSNSEPYARNNTVASKNEGHTDPSPKQSSSPTDNSEQIHGTHNEGSSTPRSTKSWYGGTWPKGNKATPVTQVAKESISAAAGLASEAVATARAHTPPLSSAPAKSPAFQSLGSSSRSLPLAATTTKLNITSNAPTSAKGDEKVGRAREEDGIATKKERADASLTTTPQIVPTLQESSKNSSLTGGAIATDPNRQKAHESKSFGEFAGWLSWFAKPEPAKGVSTSVRNNDPKVLEYNQPEDDEPPETEVNSKLPEVPSPPHPKSLGTATSTVESAQNVRRSWLQIWNNVQIKPEGLPTTGESVNTTTNKSNSLTQDAKIANLTNEDVIASETQQDSDSQEQAKSSGWAFWSRDTGKQKPSDSSGELALALAGAPSQTCPEKDTLDDSQGIPKKLGERRGQQLPEAVGDVDKLEKTRGEKSKTDPADASDASSKENIKKSTRQNTKQEPKNLLLPTFQNTYDSARKPGVMQQLGRWLPFTSQYNQSKHLNTATIPPKIKVALAIGVHGFFPAPLVRSFLGQPTGTSIRFANSAATAIQKWTEAQGYSCEIEKVALEGEGKIAERINLLWKLLLNWIDKISKADFVFVACHSQGCPVAMMLVAKLISFGCVSSARIGVCAMAGINLGPFIDYKSRWIGGTAFELFDFAKQDSKVSKEYEAALDVALKFGVKIVYVGSIDDQLVSLESSTFGIISHPNIYRAVFVDGRVHAPDFLTHLVGFALKLRNLGVSDHGLIRELSSPLAGSLYSGEGHSRIYEDKAVYDLGVQHALETTSPSHVLMQVQRDSTSSGQNPYILPFAMRGLLEEDFVKTELNEEILELIRQFDDWKPSSKVLKDVKFRLEGVRSKL